MHTPNARVTRTVDAAAEPITLDQAKQFLRVEVPDDDDLIAALITAARLRCESITNRSFVTTTWRLTLDYFPPYSARSLSLLPPAIVGAYSDRNYWLNLSDVAIELPYPPLLAVSQVSYVDPAGVTRTLDPAAYRVAADTPGQVTPAYGTIFPVTRPQLGAVQVTYTAGYGPTAADVPAAVGAAMRFLLASYYEHRSDDAPEPSVVRRLLGPLQWGAYA